MITIDERSAFTAALIGVDYLLSTDRREARKAFRKALSRATDTEKNILARMAEILSSRPFEFANQHLTKLALDEPEFADLVMGCAPTTDPGLYWRRRAGLDLEVLEVALAQAEMPRYDFRRGGPRDLAAYRPCTRATDMARMQPDRITERVRRRPIAPTPEQVADRRHAQVLLDGYVATRLFVAELDEEDLIEDYVGYRQTDAPSAPDDAESDDAKDPSRRKGALVNGRGSVYWDRAYFRHVADGYTGEMREAWDAANRPASAEKASEQARVMLQDAGDLPTPRRGTPRTATKPRARISDREREAFARVRTNSPVTDDARETIPFQGNGIDDVRSAMRMVAGWRCVACFIERPTSDQNPLHSRAGRLVSDDGLCADCRADGEPGIPPLRAGFGLDEFVLSRCQHLAARYPAATAYSLLADVYRRAAPHPLCRLVNRFCYEHYGRLASGDHQRPATIPTAQKPKANTSKGRYQKPVLGAGQRHGRCDGCLDHTVVNLDGFCTPCRVQLGLHQPADTSVA